MLRATLVLGLINIFDFTAAHTTTSLSLNSVIISFQPYSLFVIILTVILAIPSKNEVTVIQSESVSKLSQDRFNEDMEKFKRLYSVKSSADLSEIIEDSKFTSAAKEAAKQLLRERQGGKGS